MYSTISARLQSLVRSRQSGRVRAVWRVLVPVLAGFVTLQLAGSTAFALGLGGGQTMLATFGVTTLVMAVVLGVSARYLDRRPVREYGYRLSRGWGLDLVVGTGLGALIVATTFVVARRTGSLRVTGSAPITDGTTLVGLPAFFVAFVGVAFYEEFIYRGSFVTNTVEGLSGRGFARPVATAVALFASTTAFAFVHLPGAIAADANVALVLVKTGLLGGLFGVAHILTGELAFPMGLHLGVNYALMNVFGIGAEGMAGVPSLLAVESTATGLWSPVRGIPILVATLAGYVLVVAWARRRGDDRTGQTWNLHSHDPSDR